jgi:hypothetical protein
MWAQPARWTAVHQGPHYRRTMVVGTLRESSLHAALKEFYARPGDRLEEPVDGYWIDIVRGEQLIEIQTGSFAALRTKLAHFLPDRPVRVVLPLAVEKQLVQVDERDGRLLRCRRSPKRQREVDLFGELVHLARHAASPGFSLELALVSVAEVRVHDGRGSWRRRGVSVVDRRLIDVRGVRAFHATLDYLALLPDALPEPFTVADLAAGTGAPQRLAGQMAYTLRHMGVLRAVGKRGNALLYTTD